MKTKKSWNQSATVEDALSHGLTEKEFDHIRQVLGRELNMVELGVVSALYSEHCSYKSTKVHLKNLPTDGEAVLQGPGENAGVIDIGDGLAVVFKIESHNHPSFIEPFQGAATGVGGILRDIFTMGARPLALMNALRFGSPEIARNRYLLKRVVAGIGFYGNCIGIPTVGGELMFHASYDGNCLVNAFALGIVEKEKIFLGHAAGVGNKLFYVGSKTGRDGIHGASMASAAFDDDSEEKRPTVQVGDPFQEKILLEACLEVMQSGSVIGIQDMGAAGLTSSTYEMADRAGSGLKIYLERVPQREEGMNPYEIMLSESQERMLFVIESGKEEQVRKIVSRWGLDAVEIGEVVEGGNVELYWENELVSSMPAALLTRSVPQYRWPEKAPQDGRAASQEIIASQLATTEELEQRWFKLLVSYNISSRAPIYRQYDSTVRSNTVVAPGGDAAVIRVKKLRDSEGPQGLLQSFKATLAPRGAEKGIAMTLDCNSRFCAIDPRQGAALTLAESIRNISAVGAQAIGISDNLNFGSPEKPEGMWQIAEAVRGLSEAARAFSVPVVSGNVSLYNETKGKAILPTPILAVVGLIEDASKATKIAFQKDGDLILLIGDTRVNELAGSEYQSQFYGVSRGQLPLLDYDLEIRAAQAIRQLIDKRLLASCHDLSQGGLATGLAEACLSGSTVHGARIKLEGEIAREDYEGFLFAESGARYLISFDPSKEKQIKSILKKYQISIGASGGVGGDKIEIFEVAKLDLNQSYKEWSSALEALF
jgi:phosphoribosylformylglycinamidine synthase